MTEDGAAITMEASRAVPATDDVNRIEAAEVSAVIDLASGQQITVVSEKAEVDVSRETAVLQDSVVLTTSRGAVVEAQEITSRIDRVDLFSDRPVQARMAFGTVDAGRMELRESFDNPGQMVLVLNNGVTLLYKPNE